MDPRLRAEGKYTNEIWIYSAFERHPPIVLVDLASRLLLPLRTCVWPQGEEWPRNDSLTVDEAAYAHQGGGLMSARSEPLS